MKISELKELVRSVGKLDAADRAPVIVSGQMGIGKSQAIQQVAEELGYKYMDLRLATQEAGDLVGLPRIIDGKTHWSSPSWVPDDKTSKFMLVLEELNRAPVDVQQAIFQVLTERKIHTTELPNDSVVIACINPSDDIYHVSEMDPAMNTRFIHSELESDCGEWLVWAKQNKIDDRIVQFINSHNDLLCQPKEKGACPLPRTWTIFSKVLQSIPESLVHSVGVGTVGAEASLMFQKFCTSEYKKPVTGSEILNDYAKVKAKIAKQREDENFITAKDLVSTVQSNPELTKTQIANFTKFLLDAHSELKVKIILDLNKEVALQLDNEELLADLRRIMKEKNAQKDKK